MSYYQARHAELVTPPNLADELRGITPRKTVKGRVVNNDDPPIVHVSEQTRGTGTMGRIIEFIRSSQGRFSSFDVDETLGLGQYTASGYLHKLKVRGEVRLVGKVRSSKNKRGMVAMWERV